MADEIHFIPNVILGWYKEMDVDTSKVTSLTVGTTYTFGFVVLGTLACKKKWKFEQGIMHYKNVNGDFCSNLAAGGTYHFAVATSCRTILGTEICSTDKFIHDTITVVEEDDYQSLVLNHFKSGGTNYLFPDYKLTDDVGSVITELDIRYAFNGSNSFKQTIWKIDDNIPLEEVLPPLKVGDTISIVMFDSNKFIAFAARDCVVIDYPHIFTSRYHVLKGYEHYIRFSFDVSLNVFDVAIKSGNTEIGSKTRSQNINYVDVAVDNTKLSTGEHNISFTYNHKFPYSGTASFTINVYDNKNKDFFLLNDDLSYCQYIKSNAITFTGNFRNDLNVKDTSPFVISSSLSKNGNKYNDDIILTQDETNKNSYTFTIKEGFLNSPTSIDLYLYENNDSTYPLYSTTFTITKPTLSNNIQTYVSSDLTGNLQLNDITCPLQNITLKSKTNSSEIITINCITDNNAITCPYTLIKGYDEFDIYIENNLIDSIEIMRQLESAQFIIENQNCYEMNKDNKIKIKSSEYFLKYINAIEVNYNNSNNYIITPNSNGIRYNLNIIKNEITVILNSGQPGEYRIEKLIDVNNKTSTYKFTNSYQFVYKHFVLSNTYIMKSSYFNSFETELIFDSMLNSKDYMNNIYLDDATYTCSHNINQNKLKCTFTFASVFAPRDFKISLKCSDDIYTPSQIFSAYRYELKEGNSNTCQTKGKDINDVKVVIYSASSLNEETKFNVQLKKSK